MAERSFVLSKKSVPSPPPALTGLTLVLALLGAAPDSGGAPAPHDRPNPLAGLTLFVDPASTAERQAREWSDSRPGDAAVMGRIARQPQADWFGDWNRDPRREVGQRTRVVRSRGATPLYVVYNIPGRDCGSHSAGGAATLAAYRDWVRQFARGLGEGPAVVVLEPDALAGADCLDEPTKRERYELLAWAVGALKSRPGTVVYLDAGHPDWHPAGETAARLRRAGVARADGFALNVSNTVDTSRNVRYGREVSRLLGGAHFVIDTSRNGLGSDPAGAWCNPRGRALGPAPTARTSYPEVDAFLWIKRPGESDGVCNGGPEAGRWWPDYALELARGATLVEERG